MTEFTPVSALSGGALIGLAAVLMLAATGRIAGISGIAVRLLPPYEDAGLPVRLAFILGIIAAPLAYLVATGAGPIAQIAGSPARLAIAGLLVGFGAVWGAGCTSGHGVCGIARLSTRSLVATGVFMATAIATVFILGRPA